MTRGREEPGRAMQIQQQHVGEIQRNFKLLRDLAHLVVLFSGSSSPFQARRSSSSSPPPPAASISQDMRISVPRCSLHPRAHPRPSWRANNNAVRRAVAMRSGGHEREPGTVGLAKGVLFIIRCRFGTGKRHRSGLSSFLLLVCARGSREAVTESSLITAAAIVFYRAKSSKHLPFLGLAPPRPTRAMTREWRPRGPVTRSSSSSSSGQVRGTI